MTIRTLLNVLAVVSMLISSSLPVGKDRLPAPLYAAPSPSGTANSLEAPPAQATETPAATQTAAPTPTVTLGQLTLTQAEVYTVSLAAQVIFTDHRGAAVTAWNNMQISARVPSAGAVDGPVVVETERGGSNGSPFGVGSSAVPGESGEGTAWASTFSGQISTNTTWDENILITGDVTVTSGVRLTIAPGVTVFFAANSDDQAGGRWTDKSELHVYGTLVAEGTLQAPIYFTSNAAQKAPGDWGSIYIRKDSTTSSLANCVIHYAQGGIEFHTYREGGATISGVVRNSLISHNQTGIYMGSLPDWPLVGTVTINPTIADNVIKDNVEDGLNLRVWVGYQTANNYAVVRNNVIEGNGTGVRIEISTWWVGHGDSYPQIVNNTIRNNTNFGVYVLADGSNDGSGADTNARPTIENNLFDNNSHDLYLRLQQNGASGTQNLHPAIRYNTIRNAAYGITIDDGQPYSTISPTISHNVFYGFEGAGSYDINNLTARTITASENYWGSTEAE